MNLISKWKLNFQKRNSGEDKILITRKNLYIIPNTLGASYIILCFILYLIAVNYQNNLVYLILFILISVFFISIFHTHKNLIKSNWKIVNTKNSFAGENCGFYLQVDKEIFNAEIIIEDKIFSLNNEKIIYLETSTHKRGLMNIPRIKIKSSYPLGIFTSFTYLNFTKDLIIFPHLNNLNLISHSDFGKASGNKNSNLRGMDDFSHLKAYYPGDNIKQIHWKIYSKNEQLFIKQFSQNSSNDTFLNFENQDGDKEQKLSTLATTIVKFNDLNIPFGLILPNEMIEINHGEIHKNFTLTKLALFE